MGNGETTVIILFFQRYGSNYFIHNIQAAVSEGATRNILSFISNNKILFYWLMKLFNSVLLASNENTLDILK